MHGQEHARPGATIQRTGSRDQRRIEEAIGINDFIDL
jgi:hypothetical protein